MEKIVLIGNGGHSKVIRDLIEAENRYKLIAVFDDQFSSVMETDMLYAPISYFKKLENKSMFKLIVAIGNNVTRQRMITELQLPIDQYATIIHPTAVISPSVKIGYGTVIMPNAVINAHTFIGNHVIINTSSVVEHDNTIEDYVHIAPHATLTGGVMVGEGTQVSAAATVVPNISIGAWSLLGAGSTVIGNIPAYSKAVGSPAKIIEQNMMKGANIK